MEDNMVKLDEILEAVKYKGRRHKSLFCTYFLLPPNALLQNLRAFYCHELKFISCGNKFILPQEILYIFLQPNLHRKQCIAIYFHGYGAAVCFYGIVFCFLEQVNCLCFFNLCTEA